MIKVRVEDIFKDVFKLSALIPIPNAADLLEVPDSMFTKYEVFCSIVQNALDMYNAKNPLNRQQKMYVNADPTNWTATINGNFEYAVKKEGTPEELTDNQVLLLPRAVTGFSMLPLMARTKLNKNFSYADGKFDGWFFSSGTYYFACVCNYPLYEEYDEVTKKWTDDCAVYFMNRSKTDNSYQYFIYQVFVCLCDYIENIKNNFQLSDLPIDMFSGLETASQKYQDMLNTFYDSSALANTYVMY